MTHISSLAIVVMLGSIAIGGAANSLRSPQTGEVQGRSFIRGRFFQKKLKPSVTRPVRNPTLAPKPTETEEGDLSIDQDLTTMMNDLQSLDQEMNALKFDAGKN